MKNSITRLLASHPHVWAASIIEGAPMKYLVTLNRGWSAREGDHFLRSTSLETITDRLEEVTSCKCSECRDHLKNFYGISLSD
jgi:hypothetical protein